MLLARLIPCLLLDGEELVKTRTFANPVYVGDPVNVISIFSSLEVDEIVLLDISAPREGRGPRFDLVARVANECMMPLAYGGGISSLDDIRRLLKIGVEKVVLNSAAARTPQLIEEAAAQFGSQAVVVAIDVKSRGLFRKRPDVHVDGGRRALGVDPVDYARQVVARGAGEILLSSIDREGSMDGYDLDLIRSVSQAVDVPVIAHGGAGSYADLPAPILQGGASAAAAGSLFVFQSAARGVLIHFPNDQERKSLFP